MKVKTNNTEYKIQFSHRYPQPTNKMDQRSITHPERGGTTCRIIQVMPGGTEVVISEVSLNVYHKDRFCKETGRKYSLTRALGNAGFNKEQRTAFWEAYFGRFDQPNKTTKELATQSKQARSLFGWF